MSPILGIYASQTTGHLVTGNFESIATINLSGGETSLNFTSIPSTYKHLQIRGVFKFNGSDNLIGRFNSDTGSNYTTHWLLGQGSYASNYASSSATAMNMAYTDTGADQVAWVVDILDYASTSKYKTVRRFNGQETNSVGIVWEGSHLWQSTSAISSINFYINGSSSFTSNSTFALYGIKGA